MPHLPQKLPDAGTTIFSRMSLLAQQHGAINLGQGFPDFAPDAALLAHAARCAQEGPHQYPPMPGLPLLRERLAAVLGGGIDPDTELTITAGATQALFTALQALLQAGDEALLIEPAYDSYAPAVRLAGAAPVGVPMTAGYDIDWDALRAAATPRTRVLVLNSPHNPSGRVASAADMDRLASLAAEHDWWIVSDEVYAPLVYDGLPFVSAGRHPGLRERSFVIGSFGKAFHITGWKIGWVQAPARLTAAFRALHQYTVFTVNSPAQAALAAHLADPEPWQQLAGFYQAKRDRFRAGLAGSRLKLLSCEGSYFQTVDYSAVSDLPELEFAEWLTREIGVAAIPPSVFYSRPVERRHARLCFAKRDETLDAALARLASL